MVPFSTSCLVVLLVCLNWFDGLATFVLLEAQMAVEANPFLSWMTPAGILTAKSVLGAVLLVFLLYAERKAPKHVRWGTAIALAVYSALAIWHLIIFTSAASWG